MNLLLYSLVMLTKLCLFTTRSLKRKFLKVFSKYKYLSFSYGVDTVKRNLKLTIVELDKNV